MGSIPLLKAKSAFQGTFVIVACGIIGMGCATTPTPQPAMERCFQLQSETYDAIARFQEDRNQLPSSLSDLVPGYLPKIPENEPGRRIAYRQDRKQFSLFCIYSDDHSLRRCEMTEDRRWSCKD